MDPHTYGDGPSGDYTPHTIDFHRTIYKGDDDVAYPNIVEYQSPDGHIAYHTELPTSSTHPNSHSQKQQHVEQYPVPGHLILSYTPTPTQTLPLPQLTLCQVHPSRGKPALLAQGSIHIWQSIHPNPPILTIQVDTIRFYITPQDATVKISNQEYMFLMPTDCLGLCLPLGVPYQNANLTSLVDSILTHFFVYTHNFRIEMPTTPLGIQGEAENEVLAPTDYTLQQNQQAAMDMLQKKRSDQLSQESRTAGRILKMSAWLSEKIVDQADKTTQKVEEVGHRKTMNLKDAMNENNAAGEKEKEDLSKTAVMASSLARTSTRKTAKMVSRINDKVSGKASEKLEKHVEIRETDSDRKKRIRRITAASLEAYSQVSDALADGYGQVLETTQEQGKEYATIKYGPNGAQVAENVVATAYHTGSAAYNARRVVSVKKIASSHIKNAAKAQAESAAGIKRG
eukprot:CAMPEP_0184693872 /NCGR_PEP_ID=MMETSP0313-20130426/1995_1 /TAXON_ID=2792 /ORGANISM="Porphyridium aerugineum, Strain SAG 1380-2" /LENGTH=454 /DNA_ID=CAMNT_0027152047 /DNA_START=58 /DNA_END=1422 /DNA_ORIENTATION=+